MVGDVCNLVAAVLCTVGAAMGALAMFISGPSLPNVLSGIGCILATVGGCAWIGSAAIPLYTRHNR